MEDIKFSSTKDIANVLEIALKGSATNDFNAEQLSALNYAINILKDDDADNIYNKIRIIN